jgi:apolipoprotein N-acyltransferase
MKLVSWVVGGFASAGAAMWWISSQSPPPTILVGVLVAVLFGAPAFGAFWMMYVAIRHERNPLPMVLLSFIPFTFLWYYFERVKQGGVREVE